MQNEISSQTILHVSKVNLSLHGRGNRNKRKECHVAQTRLHWSAQLLQSITVHVHIPAS